MPLQQKYTLAAWDYFEQVARSLVAAATPKPQPKPLLTSPQTLARLSPQPDRLVAVRAARIPLLEAARPLLQALAHMPKQLDAAHASVLHSDLVHQISSFQSVCGDAHIRKEYITGSSYMLCTALDEAASWSALAMDTATDVNTWAARLLAVQFHGDGRGGENVFKIMATLLKKPSEHIDLLELLLIVIALGFEGMYRKASNGKRALDEIRHVLFAAARSCRGDGMYTAHWNVIESLLWGRTRPGELFVDTEQELFQ